MRKVRDNGIMIVPYSKAIDTLRPRLPDWRVRVDEDSDYCMTLVGDGFVFELTTERYYNPRIGITFIDSKGRRFQEFLLEQVLDPIGRANSVSRLDELIKQYETSLKTHDDRESEACIIEYAVISITSAANLKTGYNRTIVLLPRNAGTYEYGVDKTGGWTASGGVVRQVAATSHNLKTALYVNRFGFLNFPSDAASLKEIGVYAELGDRIGITPAGATAILAVIKPSTSLVSAIQFANGQVNVFADYRPISGVLFPFRTMQGANVNSLSVFQATAVELVAKEPDIAAVTRPKLTAYAAPDARALEKPFTPKEKKN